MADSLMDQWSALEEALKEVPVEKERVAFVDHHGQSHAGLGMECLRVTDLQDLQNKTSSIASCKIVEPEEGYAIVVIEGLDPLAVHPQVDTKIGPID